MKRSHRLQVVIDLYLRQENEALQSLGRGQQQLQDQQDQLQSLQSYRDDYLQKLNEQQRVGMNVNQMLEFRAFADKLDKAIEGQQQVVTKKESEVMRLRRRWEDSHQQTKSLQKLSDLAKAEELKIQYKQEQAEQDARAARSSRKDGMGTA